MKAIREGSRRTVPCDACNGEGVILCTMKGRVARVKCGWCDGLGKLLPQEATTYHQRQRDRAARRTATVQPAPSL